MAVINFVTMQSGYTLAEFEGGVGGTTDMGAGAYQSAYGTNPWFDGIQTKLAYTFTSYPTTTGVGWGQIGTIAADGTNAAFSAANLYTTVWFAWLTSPASGDEEILQVRQGVNLKFAVRIDSTGKLHGYNADTNPVGGTKVGTGTTILSNGRMYRLDLKVGTSSTVGAYELKINGVVEWSGTTNTLASNATNLRLGKVVDRNGQSVTFSYGPIVLDNANYFSSLPLAADTYVPSGNSTPMQWNPADTNQYTVVGTIPASNSNTFITNASGAGQSAMFAMTDLIDNNDQIIAVKAKMRAREITSTTTASTTTSLRVKSGATTVDTNPVNLSSINNYAKLMLVDPATSAAWTAAGVNALEVGIYEAGTVQDDLFFVGLEVLTVASNQTLNVNEAIWVQDPPNSTLNFFLDLYNGTETEYITVVDIPNRYDDLVIIGEGVSIVISDDTTSSFFAWFG